MKRTLIIFPTTFEGAVALKHLKSAKKIKTGVVDKFAHKDGAEKNLCVMISGMGCPNTIKLVEKTAKEFSPERVVICGYGGACDSKLQNGDFLYDGNDPKMSAILDEICSRAKLKCSDHIVDKEEKLQLFKDGYECVEMESEFFINAIRKDNPTATLTHIRCISDSVESEIPAEFFSATFDARDGTLSIRKILLEILKHPSLLRKLKKFADETKPVQKTYAKKVVHILDKIVEAEKVL